MSADDDLWPALLRVEVEQVGWGHGKQVWEEARLPHERCRTCGGGVAVPDVASRPEVVARRRRGGAVVNDFAVFWIMIGIVWFLWWVAARIHADRLRREQKLWNAKYRRGSPAGKSSCRSVSGRVVGVVAWARVWDAKLVEGDRVRVVPESTRKVVLFVLAERAGTTVGTRSRRWRSRRRVGCRCGRFAGRC